MSGIVMSPSYPQKIAVFGATGSIGDSTLNLLREVGAKPALLTAHSNVEKLAALCHEFEPEVAVISDDAGAAQLKEALAGLSTTVLSGADGVLEAAQMPIDWAMMAIVGAAALPVMDVLVERSETMGPKMIALANKECVVCAGPLLLEKARQNNVTILPVDSEHNAIFQVWAGQDQRALESLTLTASGGPFWRRSLEDLHHITPTEAVKHPNWSMGAKTSIDSATMMNKALEVMEAAYLFNLPENQLNVLIHPQSIVHGMATYQDGSTLAQLGMPDMRIPISYALNYPQRTAFQAPRLDLAATQELQFHEVDPQRFPAINLARHCLREGKSAPTIFNAANEVAVAAFLAGDIPFTAIVGITEKVLSQSDFQAMSRVDDVLEVDALARKTATALIQSKNAA